MDRGAWQPTVHGVAKSQAQLTNTHTCVLTHTHTYPQSVMKCLQNYLLS